MSLELSRDHLFLPNEQDFFLEITDEGEVMDKITLTLNFKSGIRRETMKVDINRDLLLDYPYIGSAPVCKANKSISVTGISGWGQCCRAMGYQDFFINSCFRDTSISPKNPRLLINGSEVWREYGDVSGKAFEIEINPEFLNEMTGFGCRSRDFRLPMKVVVDDIGEVMLKLNYTMHTEKGKAKIVSVNYPNSMIVNEIVEVSGKITNVCPVGGANIVLDLFDVSNGSIISTKDFSLDENQVGEYHFLFPMPNRDLSLGLEARHFGTKVDDSRQFLISWLPAPVPPPPPPITPPIIPPPIPPEEPEDDVPKKKRFWPYVAGGMALASGLGYYLWRKYGK